MCRILYMKTYLVTGGAGFIGSCIARKLIELGNQVYIIDNLSTGYRNNIPLQAEFIEGDCSDLKIYNKLKNIKFDSIFHIAGQSSGEISFENPANDLFSNTLSTLRLLEFCLENKCQHFLYASTMSVYGLNSKECFSESDVTNPISFYAVGKKASEEYLKIFSNTYGINYTALRYFNVYGPGQNLENLKQGMVSIYLKQFIDSSYDKVIVKGDKKRFRDLIYIDDVVNITLQANQNPLFMNKIINVGTGKKTHVYEIIDKLKTLLTSNKDVIYHNNTPGDQFGLYADTNNLKNIYTNELTSFDYGLKMFVNSVLKTKP